MSHNWASVPLDELTRPVARGEIPEPGKIYRQLGVRLWGEGAYERATLDGADTQYPQLFRCEEGDIVMNKIWARNGSVAVVPAALAGAFVSGEFPTFEVDRNELDPRWMHWLTKTKLFWDECDAASRGSSGKNRIRPEKFLEIQIPRPPLPEQQRIVARIEELQRKIDEAGAARDEIRRLSRGSLLSWFQRLIQGAPWKPMMEVAPLTRRPVTVEPDVEYLELGIRSYGKGTFHKAGVTGFVLGDKKMFRIEPGDLLFNIVFAWEGAVAVARPGDAGRVGSHRFLTCVPVPGVATADFLKFHFLTFAGLDRLGQASPGGAGRNRTLGVDALARLTVPVPEYSAQLRFDEVQRRFGAIDEIAAESDSELDGMTLAILAKAIAGDL